MTTTNPYPWQESQWQSLVLRWQTKTLPHALLLTGSAGMGKLVFATALATLLICQNSTAQACGHCASCRLVAAKTHPDLLIVQPEEDSKIIKIDQIRELIEKLTKTSTSGGVQVVIIEPANKLNPAAANALLKTLEEPSGQVIIMLITAHPSNLPATIRSRCQQITFSGADKKAVATAWLKQQAPEADCDLLLAVANYAPLKAIEYANEDYLGFQKKLLQQLLQILSGELGALECAARYAEIEITVLLPRLTLLLLDIQRFKQGGQSLFLFSTSEKLALDKIPLLDLLAWQAEVTQLSKLFSTGINLNQQLALENLFINISRVGKGALAT